MEFREWKASARRVHLDDMEQGPHILEYFNGDVPGDEAFVFGPEGSWLVIVPKEDGTEAYHVVADRWSDEVADFDEAVRILWEQHAQYEQDDTPALD